MVPVFAFAQNPAASVEVSLLFYPLSGDTFGPDEEIRATVKFSTSVTVTGNPELTLRIGDQTRRADLYSSSRESLYFRHFVEASDSDDDGISIPANAVLLNGGSIRDSQGNDVDLTHNAVPDDARRKVNGRLDVLPTITRVAPVYSQSDTVGRGEPLLVLVEFSELIEVTGTPQLTLQVGSQPRQADFHLRRNSSLFFEYFVQASDVDTDGISVPADALTLNGGSIRDAHGNDADLTHEAVPDDPERKVNGAPTVSLAVERVYFSRPPASQDTYEAGETIVARVRFTRGIHVTGTPQLALQVGAQERRADHFSRLEAAAFLPPSSSYHLPADQDDIAVFRYVVQPSDADDDGISVPANALTLNGGSIRAVDDNSEADLGHDGLPDDPTRRVDGSRADDHAPAVQSGWIEPPTHGAFRTGDAITVRLRFSESVAVTGAPGIALRIGEATRLATVTESWESTTLLFEYIVEESDRDDDGLSITADAVDLNGGTIKDNAGNDANLDLGYFPFDNDPNLKVNPPQLTPVPTLPLGGVLVLVLALLGAGWRRLAWRSSRAWTRRVAGAGSEGKKKLIHVLPTTTVCLCVLISGLLSAGCAARGSYVGAHQTLAGYHVREVNVTLAIDVDNGWLPRLDNEDDASFTRRVAGSLEDVLEAGVKSSLSGTAPADIHVVLDEITVSSDVGRTLGTDSELGGTVQVVAASSGIVVAETRIEAQELPREGFSIRSLGFGSVMLPVGLIWDAVESALNDEVQSIVERFGDRLKYWLEN